MTLGLLPRDAVGPDAAERLAVADALRARARDAMATNRDVVDAREGYLALSSPTNAQVGAQVRALTRSVRAMARHQTALIRLTLDLLEGTD